MEIPETLLGSSVVYLFGRSLVDIILKPKFSPTGAGANRFMENQFRHQEDGGPGLARIYAFAFEGTFIELDKPAIFLVHGSGDDPSAPSPANQDGAVEYKTLARVPGSSARTGLGFQLGSLAVDMKVWAYDKGDFSMRLDVETGMLEQILLGAEINGDGSLGRSSGGRSSNGRSSGGRSSNVMGRSSGWIGRRGGDLD